MTTKTITIPYQPRSSQLDIHNQLEAHRWAVMVIHRRFGKTYLLLNHIIKCSLTTEKPNARFAYIAPFLKQAKILAWDYLKRFCDPIPGRIFSESDLKVTLPGDIQIRLFGADNPDALRGVYLDGAVLDEYAQINPTIFTSIIRPALSDRMGWCVFSGTPNGRNHFFEMLQHAKSVGSEGGWYYVILRASDTGIVPKEELEDARRTMSEEEYEREYECSFDSIIGKKVYPEFNMHMHVSPIPLYPTEATTIYRGWDNTGLHPGVVLTYLSPTGQWIPFKDFWFEDCGAMEATETIITWCNIHLPAGCKFEDYADPAGKNRDSSKMSAAIYIMQKSEEMGSYINLIDGIQTWKVRRESVATKLRSLRNGQPAILIGSECKYLIEGFSGGYAYRGIANMPGHFTEDAIKNKYADVHDALQYVATRMFTTGNAIKASERFGDHYSEEDDEDMFEESVHGRNATTGY